MSAQGNVHIRHKAHQTTSSSEKGKNQVTDTFSINISGHFLPIKFIYQGNMSHYLLKVAESCRKFPDDWNVIYIAKYWSNESKSIQRFQMVLFLYVEKRKFEFELPEDQKTMLIFNVFKGHITENIF